jgi:hypothetical protein
MENGLLSEQRPDYRSQNFPACSWATTHNMRQYVVAFNLTWTKNLKVGSRFDW